LRHQASRRRNTERPGKNQKSPVDKLQGEPVVRVVYLANNPEHPQEIDVSEIALTSAQRIGGILDSIAPLVAVAPSAFASDAIDRRPESETAPLSFTVRPGGAAL
jgi:hypothetical protein